jgi:hypothetical protein
MNHDAHKLPLRPTANGDQIETRPIYIEEWLDSLPYIDFHKTSQLLYEATRATNEQVLKPSIRLELIELYNRPYQYYIDSQVKAGAQHTLQSIDSMQTQIRILKMIAVNLGLACKISAEDTLKKKTLWGQSKPPLMNMLLSLNYLSHALIFSFLEYAPTPKNVWREINFVYDFAESINQQHSTIILPKNFSSHGFSSIAQAYKRIAFAALADPHHLPYGAIWEIYEQLSSWSDLIKVVEYKPLDNPACQFVVKLNSDSSPLPYGKFNTSRASDKHRLLDGTELYGQIQVKLDRLAADGTLDESVLLSPYYAKIILGHMARVWGEPLKRVNPRKEREGRLELACGLNPVWYFINNEQEFQAPANDGEDADVYDHASAEKSTTAIEHYRVDQWSLVDQSARGFAVIKNIMPIYKIRVGDLVVIKTGGQGSKWAIGVIRWLMIRQSQIFKIGVQILSLNAIAVAVRAVAGSTLDTRYRRALLIKDPQGKRLSVITSKGLYLNGREIEILYGESTINGIADTLTESTTGFEQFTVNTAT